MGTVALLFLSPPVSLAVLRAEHHCLKGSSSETTSYLVSLVLQDSHWEMWL